MKAVEKDVENSGKSRGESESVELNVGRKRRAKIGRLVLVLTTGAVLLVILVFLGVWVYPLFLPPGAQSASESSLMPRGRLMETTRDSLDWYKALAEGRDIPVRVTKQDPYVNIGVNDSVSFPMHPNSFTPWVQTPTNVSWRIHKSGGSTSWGNVYYIDDPSKPYPIYDGPHSDGSHGNGGKRGIGTAMRFIGEGVVTVYTSTNDGR